MRKKKNWSQVMSKMLKNKRNHLIKKWKKDNNNNRYKWTSTNQTNKYIWRRNLQSVDYWVHVKEYSQTNKKCKVKTIKLHPRRKGNLGHCMWTSQGKMTQIEVSHWRDGCHKLLSKQTDSIIFPDGMWAGPYNLCWYNIWHNLRQWAWFWLYL